MTVTGPANEYVAMRGDREALVTDLRNTIVLAREANDQLRRIAPHWPDIEIIATGRRTAVYQALSVRVAADAEVLEALRKLVVHDSPHAA